MKQEGERDCWWQQQPCFAAVAAAGCRDSGLLKQLGWVDHCNSSSPGILRAREGKTPACPSSLPPSTWHTLSMVFSSTPAPQQDLAQGANLAGYVSVPAGWSDVVSPYLEIHFKIGWYLFCYDTCPAHPRAHTALYICPSAYLPHCLLFPSCPVSF